MADKWECGDMALAIGEPAKVDTRLGYRKGGIYTVQSLGVVWGKLSLSFNEMPGLLWRASAFRKIPRHTPDAEDEETIRLLRGEPVEPVA